MYLHLKINKISSNCEQIMIFFQINFMVDVEVYEGPIWLNSLGFYETAKHMVKYYINFLNRCLYFCMKTIISYV